MKARKKGSPVYTRATVEAAIAALPDPGDFYELFIVAEVGETKVMFRRVPTTCERARSVGCF